MKDSISFDTVPIDEEGEQLGPDYDPSKAREEANRLIKLLRKKFGDEPEGAKLRIKSNLHDFGSYLSVDCQYDDSIDDAVNYCFDIESDFPTTWENGKKKR